MTDRPAGTKNSIDFRGFAARLLKRAPELLSLWFPNGRVSGHEFIVGNLQGDAGKSLSINLDTGKWADFAFQDVKGGDLISLYAAMHNLTQYEAARELQHQIAPLTSTTQTAARNGEKWSVLRPVPEGAPEPPNPRFFKIGSEKVEFVARWAYHDELGRLLGYVVRFRKSDETKGFAAQTYCRSESGECAWRRQTWSRPRPIYGLEKLARYPKYPVIVVEGEKKCDAAQEMVDDRYVVVGWPGGAQSVAHCDWRPLYGRQVTLWPDADSKDYPESHARAGQVMDYWEQPGPAAMRKLAGILHPHCPQIDLINVAGQPKDGWDAADAHAAGWNWSKLESWMKSCVSAYRPPEMGDLDKRRNETKPSLANSDIPSPQTHTARVSTEPRRLFAGGRAQALCDADEVLGQQPEIYQRNGVLVQIGKVRDAKKREDELIRRDPESLILRQMGPDHVLNMLARMRWVKLDKRSNILVPTDFPQTYARGVVCATEWEHVKPLTAIIGAPTLDEHFNVIDTPGYNAETGLLLTTPTKFDAVPQAPTKDDALAALRMLREPFRQFPWVRRDKDPPHATAAELVHIAAILTAGTRHLYDTAPAFGYDAPRRGSGKSLLGDAVGIIWHGLSPPHANYAKGNDEFRKMIAACLVAGDRIIMIDNVDRPLRSPELCNALTTTRYSDRKLGYTERYVLDARVTWIANGNNLSFVGDLARRVIVSRIDPEEERPEQRRFLIPRLPSYIAQHRRTLVPAALTIIKAFALANPSLEVKPMGSFEQWSRMIREPLIWLGMPDPVETTDEANETEPETQTLVAVLNAWRSVYGNAPKTAPEIVADATEGVRDRGTEILAHPELRQALESALGGPREIGARGLGNYLRRWKGVIAGGKRVRAVGTGHAGYTLWRVEQRGDDGNWS